MTIAYYLMGVALIAAVAIYYLPIRQRPFARVHPEAGFAGEATSTWWKRRTTNPLPGPGIAPVRGELRSRARVAQPEAEGDPAAT